MKAAQSSSLDGMDDRHMCSNATLLMNLRHIVKNSVDSFCMLLEMYSSPSLVTFIDLWLHYTLNKLDTLSNRIYVVRNPRAGYVTTSLCSVVRTTTLGFLNRVDFLDSVSNYIARRDLNLFCDEFMQNMCI